MTIVVENISSIPVVAHTTCACVLTFVSSLVRSTAWPLVILIIFLCLRNYLIDLIPNLRRLKYKDIEVEFRQSIHELKEQSDSEIRRVPDIALTNKFRDDREKIYAIAELSPRSGILEAWLRVEDAAIQAIQALDSNLPKSRMIGPLEISRYLQRNEILNSSQIQVFNKLRTLRNKAVHLIDVDIAASDVKEFIDIALALANQILDSMQSRTNN